MSRPYDRKSRKQFHHQLPPPQAVAAVAIVETTARRYARTHYPPPDLLSGGTRRFWHKLVEEEAIQVVRAHGRARAPEPPPFAGNVFVARMGMRLEGTTEFVHFRRKVAHSAEPPAFDGAARRGPVRPQDLVDRPLIPRARVVASPPHPDELRGAVSRAKWVLFDTEPDWIPLYHRVARGADPPPHPGATRRPFVLFDSEAGWIPLYPRVIRPPAPEPHPGATRRPFVLFDDFEGQNPQPRRLARTPEPEPHPGGTRRPFVLFDPEADWIPLYHRVARTPEPDGPEPFAGRVRRPFVLFDPEADWVPLYHRVARTPEPDGPEPCRGRVFRLKLFGPIEEFNRPPWRWARSPFPEPFPGAVLQARLPLEALDPNPVIPRIRVAFCPELPPWALKGGVIAVRFRRTGTEQPAPWITFTLTDPGRDWTLTDPGRTYP